MHITVLSENTAMPPLKAEWGLSFHVETEAGSYLVDTGASGRFASNAACLGIDIAGVDECFISHAHHDHGGGLRTFARINRTAPIHIAGDARENCYSQHRYFKAYIGLRRGTLLKYSDRLIPETPDNIRIGSAPGSATAIPHFLDPEGGTSTMFIRDGRHFSPDTFRHEQTIVFREADGLVVFSPCSHLGLTAIIKEVRDVFPDEPISALIGGFHLMNTPEEALYKLAWEVRSQGIGSIYTGHCTGERAIEIFTEVFTDRVFRLTAGMTIDL